MDISLEYRLRIIPAQAGQPWQAILEGNGVVLRFSNVLDLVHYFERIRFDKIISADPASNTLTNQSQILSTQ
jgi:hypothetical protein